MPPYPMMPFAVDAILRLRAEASAKLAELRAALARRQAGPQIATADDVSVDVPSIPLPRQPARRAA